jgi:phosphate transport system substrate-binding protein
MDKWIDVYGKEKGVKINYQAQGSRAGINQMIDKAVDFGCTDAFMKPEQLDAAAKKGGDVVHVPLAMIGIVPAYNLEGVDKPVNFSGDVLADIFLGKITKWNDKRLAELNEGVKLPDRDIAVVTRSDSSGSTNIFTEYLSKVSPGWKEQVGSGTAVKWKVGTAENQNAGVAGAISKSPGTIGYVELFYAIEQKIPFGAVKNRAGKFVRADTRSVSKAAEGALKEIPEDLRFTLIDAPGEESYPISGATWAVMYVKQPEATGRQLVDFFTWVIHDGQKLAQERDYAPLPKGLVEMTEKRIQMIGK